MKTKLVITVVYACCCCLASAAIIDVWNFTGGSTTSSNGASLSFLTTSPETPDIDGNNQLNVTRGNGTGANISLGGSYSTNNTKNITVSITLADFDFSKSNNQAFGFEFRSGATTVTKLKLDTIATPTPNTRLHTLTGSTVAGIAINSAVTTAPLTYGLTLNFEANTYTCWIGTPTSDGSTWASRYGVHTGTLNLETVNIDSFRPTLENHATGDRFNIDQLQISYEAIPEPATLGLVFIGGILVITMRRRAAR